VSTKGLDGLQSPSLPLLALLLDLDDRLPVRRQDQPRARVGDLDPVAAIATPPELVNYLLTSRGMTGGRDLANFSFLSRHAYRAEARAMAKKTNLQHRSRAYCPRRLNRLSSDSRHINAQRV
jgi:hypothetical protein